MKATHCQVDNKAVLSYFLKMGVGGGGGSKERTYDQIEQLDLALSSKSQ